MRFTYCLILSVVQWAALAHHGPGQFDASQQVEVTGAVTEVRFVNPHGYIYFDVTESDGSVTPWRCQLTAGSLLRRAGWTEALFPIGETITVTGSQGRLEPHACALGSVVLADGSVLQRDEQRREIDAPTGRAERLVAGRLELSGTWAAPQRNPQGGAAGGGMAPAMGAPGMGAPGMGAPGMGGGGGPALELTDAGRAVIAGLTHQKDNPRYHCMAVNILFDWQFNQHVNEIVQTDDEITLRYGFMDIVRTIRMDLDEHPDDIVPGRAGHSIGRWEDGALIVDTVGFEEGFIVAGPGGLVPHSEDLHIVEHFTYDAETQGLTRSYTAEDPRYFNGTYAGQHTVYPSDVPFEPYACVELKDAFLEVPGG